MKNVCSRIGFGCPVMAAALAVTMGFSSGAHAVIDYGRTIDSVTTSSYHSDDGHGSTYSSTTATVVDHAGVFDGSTGLTWIKATSLEEGQAQGYRPATTNEFSALMLGKGWTVTPGSEGEWSLTNGLSYTTSSNYTYGSGSSYRSDSVTNLAPVSFTADASMNVGSNWQTASSTSLSTTLGWLDDGGGKLVAGGWFDRKDASVCIVGGGRNEYCATSTKYAHEAVVADFSGLLGGAYDSANHTTGSTWSTVLKQVPQTEQGPTLMYFMVAVPEPGTQALMGLGLAGLLLVARRRERNRSVF